MKVIELRTLAIPSEHRCWLCGSYFDRDEMLYKITQDDDSEPIRVHKHEFDEMCETMTREAVVERVAKMPAAEFKGFTDAQLKHCHAFIEEIFGWGFHCLSIEGRTIFASQPITYVTVQYDIVLKKVYCNHNGKQFLYNGLFMKELENSILCGLIYRISSAAQ